MLGGVAALVSLVASYVVVEADAPPEPPDGRAAARRSGRSPLIQVVLPLAACGPVALALQSVL